MDPSLQRAIDNDDVDELYRFYEQEGNIFDREFEDPFTNTPLHNAADKGKTLVAMEIAILKPSYTRKLNRGGHSPMHLALQKKHYHTARALMTLDPKLIRVRGRGGITSLHFVAGEKGDNEQEHKELLEFLAELLFACKSCIEDLTSKCKTAVHIAVETGNIKAFKVLFGWLKRVRLIQILNWKDQDGNTALHIAASEMQPEIINLLIEYTNVNAKNFRGETAMQIFRRNLSGIPDGEERFRYVEERFRYQVFRARQFAPSLSLSEFFSMKLTTFEECVNFFRVQDDSTRNIILVVSALIAAATYQAALTPPGGYWQDSSPDPTANSSAVTANSSSIALGEPHQAGNIILGGWRLYWYTICNSTAFFSSIATILVAFTLEASTSMVYISLPLLCAAYFFSYSVQIPESSEATVYTLGLVVEFFLLAVLGFPLYTSIKHGGVQRRVDATWRCL